MEGLSVIDGIFVFDNAIHVYDQSDANLSSDSSDAVVARDMLARDGTRLGWPGQVVAAGALARRWSCEEVYDLVFEQSPTDLAMAQVVPIFDWYRNSFSPLAAQHEMAERYPDRVVLCGGVDPNHPDLATALDELDYQIDELGARSIKFYNAHIDKSWRCDDEDVAYPLYARCRELGVRVLQFHKGFPFGLMNVEHLRPVDLQAPARDFPDMTFVVHHLALPCFDEMISIASRFPNVYLSLASNVAELLIAPRRFQDRFGRLLMEVGPDKLIWGSDAALLGCPRPYLEAFMGLSIPEDLREGFGYPEITRDDRAKFLGRNFARIMNIEIEAAATTPIGPRP